MNYMDPAAQAAARMSPIDMLLMSTAVRVQLPPSSYELACDRFETISAWLRRESSAVRDLVEDFYPQGSFSIGATTRQAKNSRADDGFDIDGMLQLAPSVEMQPDKVLTLVYDAIRGQPGSRYYDKTRRRSRCVTIDFADMHFDVTPTVLLRERTPKTGLVFEAKSERPRSEDKLLIANPGGFSEWFLAKTSAALGQFGHAFEHASIAYDRQLLETRGDTASAVPDQVPAYRKPVAVVALQLLKRWRCVTYDSHSGDHKLPPSVLLAYFAAENSNRATTLNDELRSLAVRIHDAIQAAKAAGKILEVPNPRCSEDLLTDRWPRNDSDQKFLLAALKDLVAQLDSLQGASLATQRAILVNLFGEAPGGGAVDAMIADQARINERNGPAYVPGRARMVLGAVPAATPARNAPPHRFFGDP